MREHQSITVQRDMLAIVEAWPALLDRLARAGSTDKAPGKAPKRAAAPIPIDAHVSDVIGEITEWVVFLARVLMDEVLVERVEVVIPFVPKVLAEPWAPRATSTPDLLREIAEQRVGHFTEHDDEGLALGVADEAARLAKLARRTAYPSGWRKIRLGIPCVEHDTSDLGERIPCTGQYETLLDPDETIGDLVCTQDETHRMTPLEWHRAQKRDPVRDRDIDALLHGAKVRWASGRMGA